MDDFFGVLGVGSSHLLEVGGRLDLPNGHHESVSDNDANVCTRVAVGAPGELGEVVWSESVRRVPYVNLKHPSSWRLLGERDVDSLLEATSDGGVQPPRDVRGPQNQDPIIVHPNPLHLNQKLCLDSTRGIVLRIRPRTAERVHLVNEDDGRFAGPSQLKEVLDESLALSQPLGDEIGGGDGEEGGLGFGRHCLGEV